MPRTGRLERSRRDGRVRCRLRAAGVLMGLAVLLPGCAEETPKAATETWQELLLRRDTDKAFEDVIFELEFAITEHNYRITGRNTIGRALRDRGYADFPDAEVIHFCSLERAREVLLLDPAYLALMPCRVSVHVEDGRTVVQGNLLPTTHASADVVEFAVEVNRILGEIIEFATQPEG